MIERVSHYKHCVLEIRDRPTGVQGVRSNGGRDQDRGGKTAAKGRGYELNHRNPTASYIAYCSDFSGSTRTRGLHTLCLCYLFEGGAIKRNAFGK
jgi:hypothetical protein